MKRLALLAASTAVAACSPVVWRPLATTEAATDLTQVTRSTVHELDPAVSPDARSLAYEVAASLDAPPHIVVMSLAGVDAGGMGTVVYSSGEVKGREPAWKPDGSGLFFLSAARAPGSLMAMTPGGPGALPIVADAGEVTFAAEWPAVSPDGSTIAMGVGNADLFHTGWSASRHFDQALGFVPAPGRGLRLAGEGTEPSWSPDGKSLAFVRLAGAHTHLFVAAANGSGAAQITEGPSDDEEPSWSPDGQRIVFCSANAAAEGRQADLFTVRPDGSGLVQLTEGDHLACHPTWGRDGFVYFHADATGRFHVYRLRPR